MQAGIEVKILKGSNKGCIGRVSNDIPSNARQTGKIPVLIGAKNQLVWVKPDCLEEEEVKKEKFSSPFKKWDEGDLSNQILERLSSVDEDSEVRIAIELDASLLQVSKVVELLEQQGKIEKTKIGGYRKCKNLNSKQSDYLKESEASPEQPKSLEDSSGLSPASKTATRSRSCEQTLSISSGMETQEDISPRLESTLSPQEGLKTGLDCVQRCDVLQLADPNLLLLSNLEELSSLDLEGCLEDSEWLVIDGRCRLFSADADLKPPEFLLLPFLMNSTSGKGKQNRQTGLTTCDADAMRLKIITEDQFLSLEAIATLLGFPATWISQLGSTQTNPTNISNHENSTPPAPTPNKRQSSLKESKLLTPISPGKIWLDPRDIDVKSGTQSRVCDKIYEVNPDTVEKYADSMREGLWDFRRKPLPVAFVDSKGKLHAADCHHRVSAAIAAGVDKIFVDVRAGELLDARLFSVRANTDHGLPLRPKDQRRRIEMLLDDLQTIDEERAAALLESVESLTPTEKANSLKVTGKWTARTIAKFLKLTESGYRTVQNILVEREQERLFKQFEGEEYALVKGDRVNWEARISSGLDRRGVFVVPMPWVVGAEACWVQPSDLVKLNQEKISLIIQAENQIKKKEKITSRPITSVKEEIKQLHKDFGIPESGLPEIDRNEGFEVVPETIVSVAPSAIDNFDVFINNLRYFDRSQLLVLRDAIADRLESLGGQE